MTDTATLDSSNVFFVSNSASTHKTPPCWPKTLRR